MKTKLVIVASLVFGILPIASLGQQQERTEEPKIVIERHGVMQGPEGGLHPNPPIDRNTFVFVASEMGFDARSVKGAPYSAEAITEAIHTLNDGNRIIRKSSASLYRDGEGRTRREQTLAAIGPFATAGEPPRTIFINDPVAGVSYMLDPRTRTARKTSPVQFRTVVRPEEGFVEGKQPAAGGAFVFSRPAERVAVEGNVIKHRLPQPGTGQNNVITVFERHGSQRNVNKESLGKQNVEGVEVEGTRETFVIPAGEIGNERPIEVVSERWYSPELQAVIMTTHRDPRFGETTYRLTNINRGEPARALFEVPGDYTVKDAVVPGKKILMAKPASEQ